LPTNKKKNRLFWWILGILFVFYIGNYIALENGYYETKVGEKATLTAEQIKKFEEDVASGKEIDVEDYLINEVVPNTNSYSKAGLSFSTKVENFMTKGINNIGKILSKLFGY